MPETSFVSVIIPYYNRLTLVQEAVENVIAQSYRPIEIILVDDCSQEAAPTQWTNCTEANGIRIKYYRNEKNLGPGGARRNGRAIATGVYIAYLDSDDRWEASYLEKLVSILQNSPEVGMAFCNTATYTGGALSKFRVNGEKITDILPALFTKRYWCTSSAVWRAGVSRAVFWHDIRDHEDYLHEINCATVNNTCIYHNEALCLNYKDAPARIMRSQKEVSKFLEAFLALQQIHNGYKKEALTFLLKLFRDRKFGIRNTHWQVWAKVLVQLISINLIAGLYFFSALCINKGIKKRLYNKSIGFLSNQ